jgi:protein TonB
MAARIISSFVLLAVTALFSAASGPPVLTSFEAARILLVAPKPEYPNEARVARLSGSGLFQMVVSKTGEVTSVRIRKSTGHRVLDEAAARALIKWRFKPGAKITRANLPLTFQP